MKIELIAITTTNARCVNVAQPNPYRSGSVVSTLTTTKLNPLWAVTLALTLLIFTGANPF